LAPSAARGEFGEKAGASSLLHFIGEPPHAFIIEERLIPLLKRCEFLGDHAAFTARERRFGMVQRQKKFRPLPLAVLPQSEGLLHRVLFGVEPSTSMARRAIAF
jgi:hypothetical protein